MTCMHPVKRRLVPLFVYNLAIGFMFHYSIVFPFMGSLGFTTSQLVAYAFITNLVVLLVEVPSGILADRWSRKGVLLTSLLFMSVGCILLGSADTFAAFILATIFTGLFFGMSSGVQAAMLYDALLESNRRDAYEKMLGLLRSAQTTGLVLSSIAGAVLASQLNFQIPFYLSVVSCIIGFLALAFFREPRLHREVESAKLVKHVADLVKLLVGYAEMRLLVVTNVLIGIVFCFMLEVDPLWPLALGLATILYGPLNALLLSSQGLAGLFAGVASMRAWLIKLLATGMLFASIGLTIENIYLVVVSQFILVTCATTLMIILSGRMQDNLPSSQRSGSESAISTVSTLSFMALLLPFTLVANNQSVFAAAWIIVGVTALSLIGMRRLFKRNR